MPKHVTILLDQNIPFQVADWLRLQRPQWKVVHTKEVELSGKSDEIVFQWAQDKKAIIITFDEDFADQRSFPVGKHYGVVRLRVWPTTIEETQSALSRLIEEFSEDDIREALIIIDRAHIRVRHLKKS